MFILKILDVLNKNEYLEKKYDIAIDKGTYDAISLSPVDTRTKRLFYKDFLCETLKKNSESIFIITSCNWTTSELIEFFTSDKGNVLTVILNSKLKVLLK